MENSNELRIKLYSYDYRLLDNAIKMIVGVARATSAGIKGPIPLPIKKEVWTVPVAPNAEKPAMEQFERRTHKRLIILTSHNDETISGLKHISIPAGVEIKLMQK